MSCMTIITRSDIRPHMKWAVSLVFAYGHFNIPLGVSEYIWINILTHDPGGGKVLRMNNF